MDGLIDKKGKELIRLIQKGEITRPVYGDRRLYLDFSCVKRDGYNLVSAYSPFCNLDCYYCFSYTRDFIGKNPMKYIPPSAYRNIEENIGFYTPSEVFEKMMRVKERRYVSRLGSYEAESIDENVPVDGYCIQFCEPSIGFQHLLGLIPLSAEAKFEFHFDTNGILLGNHPDYIRQLKEYKDYIYIYLTLKAATPESFLYNTRKPSSLMRAQYRALEELAKYGFRMKVIYMCGPKFGNEDEKELFEQRIRQAGIEDFSIVSMRDYENFYVAESRSQKVKRYVLKKGIQTRNDYNPFRKSE